MRYAAFLPPLLIAFAGVAQARDSLGIFGGWGAFRDPPAGRAALRCYALAEPENAGAASGWRPFASVGYWPRSGIRGQTHIRLSRAAARGAKVTLSIGQQRFTLVSGGADAWARDKAMDAAIIAAMRNGTAMSVASAGASTNASPNRRGGFADIYALRGAATAIDAAALGCVGR